MTQAPGPEHPADWPQEIGRLMVQTVARAVGRGPEQVDVRVHGDAIWAVLHDLYTTAERTLLAAGKHDAMLQARRALQPAVKPTLARGTELITGRHVRAVLTDHHVDPDVAIYVVLLRPVASAPAD